MNNKLRDKALSLFDCGIKTFLSEPETRKGIDGFNKYEPVEDREKLAKICEDNPGANLEVVVGTLTELVALSVGVGKFAKHGEASFNSLCEKFGSPETVSCSEPTGGRYYFFEYADSVEFGEESGLKMITEVESLVVDTLADDERCSAKSVHSLLSWLGREETPADEAQVEAVKAEDNATICDSSDEEITVQEHVSLDDIPLEQETVTTTNSEEVLRQKIILWAAEGSEKDNILAKALEWNRAQMLPVMVEGIVNLVDELVKTAPTEVESLAGEDLLFKLAEGTFLFHDGLNDPYFHCDGVPFKAPSKDYEGQLQYRYYQKTKQLPKAKDLNKVLCVLKSQALYEGPQVILKNRVSDKDGEIVYDLNDKRYLKVSDQGWKIVPAFPLFYRHKHQQAQVEPVAGGDPWKVFDVLHIADENRLLLMVYLISLFVPRIAHPVLAVFGDQGSAKSFFCTVINRLVDPTLTEKIIQPKNERDLIQTLRQKYVSVLDNLSNIDNRVSDIFCQVCTGASISYRQLYTDQGENIAQFRHVVIVNSISLAIVNADLMDRSIILKCNRISQEDRKPEDELWEAFETARPGILGGIFDTLVKAMAIYPTIKIEKLPRLADFAKWGYAIAEALGHSGNQFIEDFSQNVKRQNESVAEKNVLCQAVLQLMSDKEVFHKSVGDAHNALKNIAKEDAKDATFPKLPHLLRKGLDILRSTLAEHGITYQYIAQRESSGVKVLFSKTAAPATLPTFGSDPPSPEIAIDVPNVADVPEGLIPVVEFDEMPGGANV